MRRKNQMSYMARSRLTAIAIAIVAANGTAQVGAVLDLTTPEARQREAAQTSVCGRVRGGIATTRGGPVRPPGLPLALEVESLNRNAYVVGDYVESALRFTNVGTKEILIPWSPDQETVFGKNCQWLPSSLGATGLRAMVSLEFMDEAGYRQFMGSHGLYAFRPSPIRSAPSLPVKA